MTNEEQYRKHIEYTFNAFCKTVLDHTALNAYKNLRRKQQFEVSLGDLQELNIELISVNTYFVHYDIPTTFAIRREIVIVESEMFATALIHLSKKRWEVLSLRFHLGYSDAEIGVMFRLCKTTIFHRRKVTLYLLKRKMGALK